MNKCELIIFDWSGVISDDRLPVYQANMKLLESYGKPTFSFEEWLPETIAPAVSFARKFGISDSDEKIAETYQKYLDEIVDKGTRPTILPGSEITLSLLKERNKKVALLSSHPTENLEKEIDEYSLRKYFDFVVGGVSDKIANLQNICDKLTIPPMYSAYVGDMIADVIAAKALGITSIAITTGYHSKEVLEKEGPDYLIEDISKIVEIIQ
jgi:phosphoglycolate phosphatase-like HAD superfamily hydrolase